MSSILEDLEVHEVSLVPKGANQGAKIALFKAQDKQEEILAMEELQKQLEDLQKQHTSTEEKFNSEIEALKAENEELKKSAEALVVETPEEDIFKGMTDEVKEKFEALQKSSEAQEAKIQKMNDESLTKDVTEVVKSLGSVVPEDSHDSLIETFKSLDGDKRDELADLFKKADAIVEATKAGLTKELGEDAKHEMNEDNPLEKAVTALMSEDSKLGRDQAVSKALDTDPSLYTGGK